MKAASAVGGSRGAGAGTGSAGAGAGARAGGGRPRPAAPRPWPPSGRRTPAPRRGSARSPRAPEPPGRPRRGVPGPSRCGRAPGPARRTATAPPAAPGAARLLDHGLVVAPRLPAGERGTDVLVRAPAELLAHGADRDALLGAALRLAARPYPVRRRPDTVLRHHARRPRPRRRACGYLVNNRCPPRGISRYAHGVPDGSARPTQRFRPNSERGAAGSPSRSAGCASVARNGSHPTLCANHRGGPTPGSSEYLSDLVSTSWEFGQAGTKGDLEMQPARHSAR